MTADGFFSIVNKDVAEGELLVRSRLKEDLERLAEKLNIPASKIVTTKMADYWYRLTVPAKDFGAYLAGTAERIDYDNFKSSLPYATATEKRRARAYSEVWQALYGLQIN